MKDRKWENLISIYKDYCLWKPWWQRRPYRRNVKYHIPLNNMHHSWPTCYIIIMYVYFMRIVLFGNVVIHEHCHGRISDSKSNNCQIHASGSRTDKRQAASTSYLLYGILRIPTIGGVTLVSVSHACILQFQVLCFYRL